MKISVETAVKARLNAVWDDWHTTTSSVDLRKGGKFSARIDGREVQVEFVEPRGEVLVKETFDAESENAPEMQRQGRQAILDNFGRHVEAKS